MATKAELESANQELRQQVEAAKAETVELGKRVAERARELAEEHEWCEVVENALTELGLSGRVPVTVNLTAEVPVMVDESWDDDQVKDAVVKAITWDLTRDWRLDAIRPEITEVVGDGVAWDTARDDQFKVEVVR